MMNHYTVVKSDSQRAGLQEELKKVIWLLEWDVDKEKDSLFLSHFASPLK